jgi:hypothetical protein
MVSKQFTIEIISRGIITLIFIFVGTLGFLLIKYTKQILGLIISFGKPSSEWVLKILGYSKKDIKEGSILDPASNHMRPNRVFLKIVGAIFVIIAVLSVISFLFSIF